jgi:hypothetical protein
LQKYKTAEFCGIFSQEAKKYKNDKFLSIIFLYFSGFLQKRPKRPLFRVLQLPRNDNNNFKQDRHDKQDQPQE